MRLKIDIHSISVQLLALVLIVAIVPVAVLAYNTDNSITSDKYQQFKEKVGDSALLGSTVLNAQQDDIHLIAYQLSTDPAFIKALKDNDLAAVKSLAMTYADGDSRISSIAVADTGAVQIAKTASNQTGDKTTDPGLLKALEGQAKTGLNVVPASTPESEGLAAKAKASDTSDELAISSYVPVRDPNTDKVIGALCVRSLLNGGNVLVDSIGKETGCYCTIFFGDTRVATTLINDSGSRIVGTKAASEVSNKVVKNEEVFDNPLTVNKIPMYVNYQPLKDNEGNILGMLFFGYDIRPGLADLNNLTMTSLGIGFVLAILAAAIGLIIASRVTRPINKLVVAANDVGSGNLDTAIEAGAKGEVGQLTSAIGKMVDHIQNRITYNESVLKGVPDPLYVTDKEGKINYVNEMGAKTFKMSRSDMIGKKFSDLFVILNSKYGSIYNSRSLQAGEAEMGFKFQIQTRSGDSPFVRGCNATIKDARGHVIGAVGLFQDVTSGKIAEETLKKAEMVSKEKALFSDSALESITDVHLTTDNKGNVNYINGVAQKLLGVSENEAMGRSLEDILGVAQSISRKAPTEQKDMYNVEDHVTARNGREIPVLINATLLKDIAGHVTGVNVMYRDITKEKEAKKPLAEITASANGIAERVADASGNVSSSVQQVMSASKQISESIQQIASGSQTEARSIESVNRLMHDMSDSIANVTDGTRNTNEEAVRANAEAKKGSENAKVAIKKMEELHVAVNDSAKIVQDLGEKSKKIGQIVEMITAIAGQTNLLALNAAIEAARAGDAGRGFAVVAEEVRKLAEEINSLIGEVRDQTARAVESMNKGTKEVDASNRIVAESHRSLEDIGRMIDTAAAEAQEIAAMTEKQTADAWRIVKDVEDMAAVIERSAAGTEEVGASSEETTSTAEQVSGMAGELAKIAEELKAEVGRLAVE
jgi:PAS domain S-box-containing protein